MDYSVVIPAYNEVDSVEELYEELISVRGLNARCVEACDSDAPPEELAVEDERAREVLRETGRALGELIDRRTRETRLRGIELERAVIGQRLATALPKPSEASFQNEIYFYLFFQD